MAIRLVRLYTGDDGESHFTDGHVELEPPDAPNARSTVDDAATLSFEESAKAAAGGVLDDQPWRRVYVALR
jgi:hypothetical protein